MTRIQALEKEVRSLTRDELAEFRAWFARFDAAQWDRQIESDMRSGRLDRLAARAPEAHRRGESRQL